MAGISALTKEILVTGNTASEGIKGWSQRAATDPASPEFRAGTMGFIGSMVALGETLIKNPVVGSALRSVAPPLALMGAKYSLDEAKGAFAAYNAALAGGNPVTIDAAQRTLFEKGFALTASIGGVVAIVPGGQLLGASIWAGASIGENYMNGNFGNAFRTLGEAKQIQGHVLPFAHVRPALLRYELSRTGAAC